MKNLAEQAYNSAERLGYYKGVNKKDIILSVLKHIRKETREAEKALDDFLNTVHCSTSYNPDSFEAELADKFLIILGLSYCLDIDIVKEAERKLEYNKTRN